MYKPSRRAAVIAASFALGLSTIAPAAHAGLLDGGNSDTAVEGVAVPGAGALGGLLDGNLLGNVLGGDLLGSLPVGNLVGGDLLGSLPVGNLVGGDLLGSLPVGNLLGGGGNVLGGEAVVGIVPDLGIVPGLGSVNEILQGFSDSGSIVPGLQVLDESGILGVLGSM